jgi:PPOX class probable FMN-dependent enzyme
MDDQTPRDIVAGENDLRSMFREPAELARGKSLRRLDKHCRNFIAHAPFLCIGTSGPDGHGDVSPRGDAPGFVKVLDDTTLIIPDRPGNNRLDSMANIMHNPNVGLLFMIPGMEETLRVNGRASVVRDAALLGEFEVNRRAPTVAIMIEIDEAFLHCSKALKRARLWDEDAKIDRKTFPPLGQMLKDQMDTSMSAEEAEEKVQHSIKTRLY